MHLTELHLDTNILVALLFREDSTSAVVAALDSFAEATLYIHIGVYGALLAAPRLEKNVLDSLLANYGIVVQAMTTEPEWLLAAEAFRLYALRRRQSGGGQPRRLLMDFVIGANAALSSRCLLTLDPQHYRQSYPKLMVISPLE